MAFGTFSYMVGTKSGGDEENRVKVVIMRKLCDRTINIDKKFLYDKNFLKKTFLPQPPPPSKNIML